MGVLAAELKKHDGTCRGFVVIPDHVLQQVVRCEATVLAAEILSKSGKSGQIGEIGGHELILAH